MAPESQPRTLIIGHTGQTAIAVQALLSAAGEVVTAGRAPGADYHIDLADPDSINACLQAAQPDRVVNAAAYNQVDLAEEEADLAMQINGHGPAQLAEWCRGSGATLIHYSTDYVFDGRQSHPYKESDPAAPLSVYGTTKLAGEQAVLDSGCHGAVLRTSWVYSRHGNNFLTVMEKLLKARETLSIVNDQYSVPTWAHTLADLTCRLLQRPQTHKEMQLFHACNSGTASRFEQVSAIREGLATRNRALARLVEIPSSDYPQAAARPMYSVMDNHKLSACLGYEIPEWRQALAECLKAPVA